MLTQFGIQKNETTLNASESTLNVDSKAWERNFNKMLKSDNSTNFHKAYFVI